MPPPSPPLYNRVYINVCRSLRMSDCSFSRLLQKRIKG